MNPTTLGVRRATESGVSSVQCTGSRTPFHFKHDILAIDPGPERSAYLFVCSNEIHLFGICDNPDMGSVLDYGASQNQRPAVVIEQVASYGMPVGEDVFETVFWSGRFAQMAISRDLTCSRIKRLVVKIAICHNSRANDANIRRALIDLIGPQGTKKHPGPTYGISKDIWSALAVAVAWDQLNTKQVNP